jgi:transcription-repair coupling factor (superfamily II helicase)
LLTIITPLNSITLPDLLLKFQHHTPVKQLVSAIKAGAFSRVNARGMAGSQAAFVAAATYSELQQPFLAIIPDREEAAYFLNDIETLLPDAPVHFFPASYKKPYDIESADANNKLLRAEVLNKINTDKRPAFIVTHPEALFERVVTHENLTKNTFKIQRSEKLSIEFANEFLQDYEFERVDFVLEPGQFAIRGGILDVFSYSDEQPFRIEFFGNEVDSIRSFNPIDQLSIKNLEFVNIVPDVQGKILKESRENFFDFISKNTVVWIKDTELFLQRIENEYTKAIQIFDKIEEQTAQLPPDQLYCSRETMQDKMLGFSIIETGNGLFFNNSLLVQFQGIPQPSFNKNFNLITQKLTEHSKARIENFIFADNSRQLERIYAIFEDIGKEISFSAINFSLNEGFSDPSLKIACYTDHQLFDRYHRFKLKDGYARKEAITLKELQGLQPGDFVTHVDHGVGRYAGLEKIDVNGKQQEAIRLIYRDNDMLYVSIHSLHRISKFTGKEGTEPKLNKLGSGTWAALKQKTKSRVKDIARDLINLYAERKSRKGFGFSKDTYLQTELEASFIYEDTPDQVKATRDVKRDMEKEAPMDRLVCGDVGFGKTEIAVRAAFKSVNDSKQVAVLVPTTILALQHYKTFSERLKPFPCNVDYINRFKSPKEQKETLQRLADGKIDIIIGTHRLISKDVKFKDLGLMIIDEEQKFGVSAKEKLKQIKINVDTLTLTATPIPRTLHFSMMGARDLSIINTPPPNRYPVQTELHTFNEEIIRDAINFEVQRGGQAFLVNNRVQNIAEVCDLVRRLCPGVRVAFGHGQMDPEDLEDVMMRFINGQFDVLVATTIIESGLDISNANTIIINNAHLFGLSDLHQMRGRVGRSNKKAFCYLLTTPVSLLTGEARKRLKAIEDFADLGSGFNIAMRDLDIRGAGDLLGAEQSGFISEIGFEMYHKILDEAISELKETDFKNLFQEELEEKRKVWVTECQIDTDLEILIPDQYITNITERLLLYKDLDNAETEVELEVFSKNLVDRFGAIPKPTLELINTIRLRWIAKEMGFEKVVLKQQTFVGYFVTNQKSAFYQSPFFIALMQYLTRHPMKAKMKEKNNKLTIVMDQMKTLDQAVNALGSMLAQARLISGEQVTN